MSEIKIILINFVLSILLLVISAWIYHAGPFSPPGTEIRYNFEKYINEPDGSYMEGVCIWNSGSKDIPNLDLNYHFDNYKSTDVLDNDFNIIRRLINASPQFGKSRIVNGTNNEIEISYPLFTRGSYFREQFYVNKPSYPITITSGTPDLDIISAPTTCDRCTCG